MAITNADVRAQEHRVQELYDKCQRAGSFAIPAGRKEALDWQIADFDAKMHPFRRVAYQPIEALVFEYLLRFRLFVLRALNEPAFPTYFLPAVAAFAAFFVVFVACVLLNASMLVTVLAGLGGGVILGGLIAATLLGLPVAWSELKIDRFDEDRRIRRLHQQALAALTQQRRPLLEERDRLIYALQLRHAYDAARIELDRLRLAFQDRRNQLLLRDWRPLRGVAFENFLAEVFEVLGFDIETTKTTGDQGVDLIAKKPPLRLAIQAKGYENSVGNGSVQEAYAGMAYYQCDRCIVITNSTFTRSARDLATRVNCLLIDGQLLPDLIAGKIRLI